MASGKSVWVIYWTYAEYGGPFHGTQPSCHLTWEESLAYKTQREGVFPEQSRRFYEDGYRDIGSDPVLKRVSKAEFKRIKGEGQ